MKVIKVKKSNQDKITSLELTEQINLFRKQEGKKIELRHYDLLKIIRNEFGEEIGDGKISESYYKNSQNKKQPMFVLTLNQAKQVLVRESKYVRRAIIQYIEKLEQQLSVSNKPVLPCDDGLLLEKVKGFINEDGSKDKRGITAVSARQLWTKLEVKTYFTDWMRRRIKRYDYQDGVDYIWYGDDYALSLDMACELALIENTDTGRDIRRYLVNYKKGNTQSTTNKINTSNTADKEKIAKLEKREQELYELLNTLWLEIANRRELERESNRKVDNKFRMAGQLMRANQELIKTF